MLYTDLKIALMAGVVAYVYAVILIQPEHILGPAYRLLKKLLTRKNVVKEVHELPEEIARKKGDKYETITREVVKVSWLLKPLGGCELCTSGQLALWMYFIRWYLSHPFPTTLNILTSIPHLIFTICLSILITRILYLTIQKLSR